MASIEEPVAPNERRDDPFNSKRAPIEFRRQKIEDDVRLALDPRASAAMILERGGMPELMALHRSATAKREKLRKAKSGEFIHPIYTKDRDIILNPKDEQKRMALLKEATERQTAILSRAQMRKRLKDTQRASEVAQALIQLKLEDGVGTPEYQQKIGDLRNELDQFRVMYPAGGSLIEQSFGLPFL